MSVNDTWAWSVGVEGPEELLNLEAGGVGGCEEGGDAVPVTRLATGAGEDMVVLGAVDSAPGVQGTAVGDLVVLSFDSCDACDNFAKGLPSYCDTLLFRSLFGRDLDGSTG